MSIQHKLAAFSDFLAGYSGCFGPASRGEIQWLVAHFRAFTSSIYFVKIIYISDLYNKKIDPIENACETLPIVKRIGRLICLSRGRGFS